MKTLRTARIYRLEPAGLLDTTSSRVMAHKGAEVHKIQPHGCPNPRRMGQAFVQTVDGDFIGLVNLASLVKTDKTAPIRDKAAEAREARSRRMFGER